ncbi:cadherin-like domain-containing protein [Vibrio aestuarianus]|uniref:cadherin-like domain-containing protein n=1 Tax=Vibrio aestuarianus TaxID=28171 RepID=UPI00237C6AE7|nr:cadherin-like domain-containing protein [Vibrio aestuarianus]MDE1238271.1 cadherin-like domain-containing protein [Vibrio aestuarianus]
MKEDLTTQVQGQLSVTDLDLGENHFQTSHITGNFGILTINKDGLWTYDLDNTNPAVQALGKVSSATDTITVHSADGTPHLVTITINGTNDTATISSATVEVAETDKAVTTSGTLTSTDVDNPDNAFTPDSITGSHGNLTIDANGHWVFTANSAFNQLNVGDKVEETFTVTSVDGTPSTIKVTINGTNDAPTMSSSVTLAAGKEDTAVTLQVSDLLTHASDIDHNAQLSIHNLSADHGQITDNHDGTFRFIPDKDYNGPVRFNYQVQDEHGASAPQSASMDLSAVGDAALIIGSGSTLKEDVNLGTAPGDRGKLQAYGQLIVVDPDGPTESGFEDPLTAGLYKGSLGGSLQVNPDGQYMYSLGNFRVDYLKEGDVAHDRFTVHSLDGTTHTLEFEIQGTNDAPYIRGNLHHAVWEDEAVLRGQLNGTDADAGDQQHLVYSTTALVAGFHLNADGSYTFDPSDSAYQHLTGRDIWGSAIKIPVTVTDQDGLSTTQNLSISVMGRNDAPVVSADVQLASGTEDTTVTIHASALLTNATDVDDSETLSLSISGLRSDHGSITDNHDGTYTFTPDPDYNGPVQFSYAVQDRNGASTPAHATMVLSAVADAATITGTDTGSVTEDLHLHAPVQGNYAYKLEAHGTLQAIDPDSGESGFEFKTLISTAMHPEWAPYTSPLGGQLAIDPKGNWNYYIDNRQPEVQQLGKNETLTDTVTVHSIDGTTHDIVITIHGTNDAPTVSSEVQLNSGKEDTVQTFTTADLLANAIDVDHNDQSQLTIANLIADHGSIRNNQDGTYTFTPDKDYNGKVHFTYDVKDAHSGVTHTGANMHLAPVGDAATISGADTGSITEDRHVLPDSMHRIQVVGSLSISDPDTGEDHFRASGAFGHERAISDPFQGEMHIDRYGNWDYVLENGNPAVQALKQGETKDVIYEVHSADGTPHRITITVTGTNDAPTVSSPVTLAAGTEDTAVTLTPAQLLANATDADHDTLSVQNLQALKPDGSSAGSITTNTQGNFVFTPEQDYHGHVNFSYEVNDGHTTTAATTSMALNSRIDHATFSGGGRGDEDTTIALNIRATEHGGDTLDHVLITNVPAGATLSAGSVDAHGNWIVTKADLANLQVAPPKDFNGHIDLTLTGFTTDGTATSAGVAQTVHVGIDVNAVNDAATVTADSVMHAADLGSTNEDTARTFTEVQLLQMMGANDADGDILHVTAVNSPHGTFSRDAASGDWTFTPTANYHGDVAVSVTVNDGHTDTQAHGTLSVASVTDAASIQMHLSTAEASMQTDHAGLSVTHLSGAHLADKTPIGLSAEIVVQMPSGAHYNEDSVLLQFGQAAAKGSSVGSVAGYQYLDDGSSYGGFEQFSVTNPKNLTIWMPGHMPIQTGIDITQDQQAHRYTFSVDLASHTATAYLDGHPVFHTDTARVWSSMQDLGTAVNGHIDVSGSDAGSYTGQPHFWCEHDGKMDRAPKFVSERAVGIGITLGDGLHPLANHVGEVMGSNGKMHAQVHDLSVQASISGVVIATGEVTDAQVAAGPLSSVGPDRVVIDLGVANGHIVDHSGHQTDALEHHTLSHPPVTQSNSLHHDLNLDVQPNDPDDHIISVKLTGLPEGTVLDDGHGHTATVQGGQAVDVQDWNRATIGVQLPANAPKGDVPLHVEVTTTGPDGTTATSAADNTSMHVSDAMTDTAPDIVQSIMLGDEDQTYHFREQDFGYSDKDGDPLDHVTITQLPDSASGQILLNGHTVIAGQSIAVSDIGGLFFQPAHNFNGDVNFQFSVSDGQKDSAPSRGTLSIAPVNDAPVLTVDIADTSDNVLNAAEAHTATISGNVDPSVAATLDRIEISDGTNTISVDGSSVNLTKDGDFQVIGVDLSSLQDGTLMVTAHATSFDGTTAMSTDAITKYTPPTISVTVDTINAHHVTAGITASTVQGYARSIGQHATTASGHHEISGHGSSDIIIVQGPLTEEAELKSGNDILYIGGRLTDEEIDGGSGSDTLILGAYNRNNAPRLHSDKIGNMEIESIENIILGDGTILKGHLPPNFPSVGHDYYEVPVNIQAHLSSSDESVSSIRLIHLEQGLTLQSNGHNINANQDGSYTVPANGHLVVISAHPISSGHHYFETEVTTHNSVTGVTAVTTEDLHGHIQSHVNPPPPPPPVQHDEPDLSPSDSVQDFTVTLDDSSSTDTIWENHAQVSHERPVGAAAYLDALGIQPNTSPTSGHVQPADMDIVLAQVDQQHAVDYDQTHLDMSDALEHHDAANNHNQDDEHHHHNDVNGLPDIDPNN